MKCNRKNMRLYVVTDRSWLSENNLSQQVEQAILGGATFVQLREKDLSVEEFICIAKQVKEVTDKYHVPFVINDNIDIALSIDADGVHVGQDDMNAKNVRNLIGKDKILGVSAQTVEQAKAAEVAGADYLGVGAVFSTSTKLDAQNVSLETLHNICCAVKIPVVAIGGIDTSNINTLKGSGIAGVAVVSAIFEKANIKVATEELTSVLKDII